MHINVLMNRHCQNTVGLPVTGGVSQAEHIQFWGKRDFLFSGGEEKITLRDGKKKRTRWTLFSLPISDPRNTIMVYFRSPISALWNFKCYISQVMWNCTMPFLAFYKKLLHHLKKFLTHTVACVTITCPKTALHTLLWCIMHITIIHIPCIFQCLRNYSVQ